VPLLRAELERHAGGVEGVVLVALQLSPLGVGEVAKVQDLHAAPIAQEETSVAIA
jgi:hypothetical protein